MWGLLLLSTQLCGMWRMPPACGRSAALTSISDAGLADAGAGNGEGCDAALLLVGPGHQLVDNGGHVGKAAALHHGGVMHELHVGEVSLVNGPILHAVCGEERREVGRAVR